MKRAAGTIVVIVLPILFVIGMFRVLRFQGEAPFLPSYDVLFAQFSSFPDVTNGVMEALAKFRSLEAVFNATDNLNADPLSKFFLSVGEGGAYFGQAVIVFFQCLLVPFKVLWWLITGLFGFTMYEYDNQAAGDAVLRMLRITNYI